MVKTNMQEVAGVKDTSKSVNQERDSADKVVFQDAELCAQFIRGYSNVSMLKNVKAEDIEDVSERFVQLFAADREADTVKRIHLENGDPMYLISLVMLFNKLQDMKDFDELKKIDPKELEEIVKNTPEALLEIMAKVIRTLFIKLNLSSEETDEMVGKLRERKVGQLFENFEKVDFQLERRLRAEAEKKAEEYEKEIVEAKKKETELEQDKQNYEALIKKLLEASKESDSFKTLQADNYLEKLYKEFGIQ